MKIHSIDPRGKLKFIAVTGPGLLYLIFNKGRIYFEGCSENKISS